MQHWEEVSWPARPGRGSIFFSWRLFALGTPSGQQCRRKLGGAISPDSRKHYSHGNYCDTPSKRKLFDPTIHMFVRMRAYLYVYILNTCITYIHTYIHACMHACMHACIHTYLSIYAYIYIYIYLSEQSCILRSFWKEATLDICTSVPSACRGFINQLVAVARFA